MLTRTSSVVVSSLVVLILFGAGAIASNVSAVSENESGTPSVEKAGSEGIQLASFAGPSAVEVREHSTAYRSGPAFSGPDLEEVLQRTLTLQLEEAPAETVGEALSGALGSRIVFVPRESGDRVSLDFKEVEARLVVDVLAKRGAGAGIATGSELYLGANAATGREVSALLSQLLGVKVEFTPRLEGDRLSLEPKDAPVEDALGLLRRYGSVQFPH